MIPHDLKLRIARAKVAYAREYVQRCFSEEQVQADGRWLDARMELARVEAEAPEIKA